MLSIRFLCSTNLHEESQFCQPQISAAGVDGGPRLAHQRTSHQALWPVRGTVRQSPMRTVILLEQLGQRFQHSRSLAPTYVAGRPRTAATSIRSRASASTLCTSSSPARPSAARQRVREATPARLAYHEASHVIACCIGRRAR